MPWYSAVYRHDWRKIRPKEQTAGLYQGYIKAKSLKDAQRIAKLRGMGEVVEDYIKPQRKRPYPPASEVLSGVTMTDDKHHALCYLGQVALASKVAKPWEILGDQGIVHDFAHYGATKRLMAEVRRIERLVPGYG